MMAAKKSGAGARKALIAPSILSADFGRLHEEVQAVTRAGADWVHVDVMDGRFVPNITIGPMVVRAVRRATRLPLDVHLMIVEPEKYIDEFAAAGADIITVHAEACAHLHRAVQQIKEAGSKLKPARKIRAGVSLNPSTSLAALDYVLPDLDLVLIMSVNPGFGGQKFIPRSLEKIKDLKWLVADQGLDLDLEVDGGVTVDNVGQIARAGVNAFVAGNTVFSARDYRKVISALRRNAEKELERP
jgi:ribulose-phosphate 3-epimerase